MKLIIDIPEELANKEHWYTDKEIWTVIRAVQNGTPIPDNATNGDMFRAFFPNGIEMQDLKNTTERWWNTPYQKGGKE